MGPRSNRHSFSGDLTSIVKKNKFHIQGNLLSLIPLAEFSVLSFSDWEDGVQDQWLQPLAYSFWLMIGQQLHAMKWDWIHVQSFLEVRACLLLELLYWLSLILIHCNYTSLLSAASGLLLQAQFMYHSLSTLAVLEWGSCYPWSWRSVSSRA